jgi:hypothetical protein
MAYKLLSLVPPYVTFASRQNVSEPRMKSFVQKTNLAYETPFNAAVLSLYEICKNGFGLSLQYFNYVSKSLKFWGGTA